jgi:tRNA A37 threonylcarbamoyladenosine biosynthesis protein TsaE
MKRTWQLNGIRNALGAPSRRTGRRRKRRAAAATQQRAAHFEALEDRWLLSTVPGFASDGRTSIQYDARTGAFTIQPDSQPVGLFQIKSASGIFNAPANLPPGGLGFDVNTAMEKAWAGLQFNAFLADFPLGVITVPGLPQNFLLSDLTLVGSGGFGTTNRAFDLVYISSSISGLDHGDAPDAFFGTGPGNYNTVISDNGPRHTIVSGLRIGANIDAEGGFLQNAAANADDVSGALPDDEDGVIDPASDLALTAGAQPTVNVRVTNTTGSTATLYGWIDANANGVFENATERATAFVPGGTNNAVVTLVFPAVPSGFTGTSYARFRLSTDVSASNPTGPAADGEVEDYRVTITRPGASTADIARTQKIGSNTGGGPPLANGDMFGSAVAAIGDLDGDGNEDMVVGAPSQFGSGNPGAVFVQFMNANGTVKASQRISSGVGNGPALTAGDYFGRAVAALGDLNGDGITDIAVGADKDDSGGYNRGAVHVLFLNANGTVKASQKIAHTLGGGPALLNNDRFGISIASLGDFDGDGIADLAVGAAGDDTGGSYTGAVHVLLLNANGTVKSRQKIASGTPGAPLLAQGDAFGIGVASLGDLDGDRVTDLAVGAFFDNTGGADRGAVHVLFLNSDGTVKSSRKIASGTSGLPLLNNGDYFGRAVASLGDLDGDGVTDLAVGAYRDDTGGTGRGALHVLLLNGNGTVKQSSKIAHNTGGGPALANDSRFGSSVAALGDLDGDGIVDLAVGAETDNTGGAARGAVHVLFLRSGGQPPVITSPAAISVPENTTFVMLVTATDPDVPPQAVMFSIVGGPDAARFNITSGGALSFNVPPNFETPTDVGGNNVYEVTVRASDSSGAFSTQTISVTVTPGNDQPPVFTSPNSVSVAENTTSVLTVTAFDPDFPPQPITFSIAGGADAGRFNITPGGALTFIVPPDFEAPSDANGDNVYVVVVQASDGSFSTLQAILVTVTPVNNRAPVFTSTNQASVPENTTFVMLVTAIDPDLPPQPVTFSIVGGADAARFNITSGGALSFNTPPDFEAPTDANRDNVYVVIVQASDGLFTSFQAILVTVFPVNNNVHSPVFTSPRDVTVPENTVTVMTVTATDADVPPQTVTFSIMGGFDHPQFSITSGGVLRFNTPPDFENPADHNHDNVYVVNVQASDGAGRTTLEQIVVRIAPVNENAHSPVFTSPKDVTVPENTTTVMTVMATDADVPPQTVTFSIVGGFDHPQFNLTSAGVLSFRTPPDFDNPADHNRDNVYVVNVQASDGAGRTTLEQIVVRIAPVPVNNHSPVFTSPRDVTVPENTTTVMTVTATDADVPPQTVTFSIVGGFDHPQFNLTSAGVLSFKTPPDFDNPADHNRDNVYVVNVQASDGAGRTTLEQIVVRIAPVPGNNHSPVFTSPKDVTVPENTTTVMTVTATDADVPPQTVTFSIVGGFDHPQFNLTSGGVLTFRTPPDFENPADHNRDNVYVVNVQASDGAGRTTLEQIVVRIAPVNDNVPVITSPDVVSIPENTTAVMTVSASDPDLPPQARTFSIVGGADQARFNITPGGALSFNTPPNFEAPTDVNGDNTYVVIVQVSDGTFSSLQAILVNVLNLIGASLAIDYDDEATVDAAHGTAGVGHSAFGDDGGINQNPAISLRPSSHRPAQRDAFAGESSRDHALVAWLATRSPDMDGRLSPVDFADLTEDAATDERLEASIHWLDMALAAL